MKYLLHYHILKTFFLFVFGGFSIVITSSCSVQQPVTTPFEGKVIYHITSPQDAVNEKDSTAYQIIYAQDTMVRIENFTPIGKQIYIKHIPKNKAYILMDFNSNKVAIQTPASEIPNAAEFKFDYKIGSSEIAGRKAKNIKVTIPNIDSTFTMQYFEDISPEYSEAIPGIPGLPAKYTVISNDAFLNYEVIVLEERKINRDLFGIPSDYQIMTMDAFIDQIQELEKQP